MFLNQFSSENLYLLRKGCRNLMIKLTQHESGLRENTGRFYCIMKCFRIVAQQLQLKDAISDILKLVINRS